MLRSLTTFRFIAALMVFLFHQNLFSGYQLGSAGVSFFFILSGFILTYNYQDKLGEHSGNTIRAFYVARLARIYPVHLLTFLISFPLVVLTFHPNGLYMIKLAFMSGINLQKEPTTEKVLHQNGASA